MAILLFGLALSSAAQCTNSANFGESTAPSTGTTIQLNSCQWTGDNVKVNGVAAATSYTANSTVTVLPGGGTVGINFITVTQGTPTGPVIAFGPPPLNWTSTVAGTYYIHYHMDAACNIVQGAAPPCNVTTLTNNGPIGPMTYVSSTVTQANTTPTSKCTLPGKEIIGVQVVTSGTLSPLNITQFTLRTNGSTAPVADVANIRIYYTGTSNVFATTNLFGTAAPAAAGTNILVNGTRALANGTNYFWVAYDLTPTATVGDLLDAQCTSITVGGVGRTPTTSNPTGTRTIAICPPSPGGVDNNLAVWLKADAGVTTSGVNMTAWANQSSAASSISVVGSPDRILAGRNYNPTIQFTMSNGVDGGDYLTGYPLPPAAQFPSFNIQSIFCAAQLSDLSRKSTHIVTYDGVSWGDPCFGCAIHGGENGTNVAEYSEFGYGNAKFQTAGVWRRNGNPAGVAYNTAHSGNFDVVTALGTGTGSVNAMFGGQKNSADQNFYAGRLRDWLGPVGELVLYGGPITTAEANRVESYLAIKYGITLGGNGATTLAYRSSANTLIWGANSGYHNDVIGIGRDDGSLLVQKQSRTPDDTTRIFLNTLATTNQANAGSFATNGTFVMIGHNKGKVCATLASAAEKPPGIYSRLEREWKVVTTAFTGNFNFSVKLNACAAPGMVNTADLRLLVDEDGNFSNATVYAAGGGLSFSYAGGIITVIGIFSAQIPQNITRYITIGSVNVATPLPIELVDFDAVCNGSTVAVNWTTASERDNAFFTVERSLDAMEYQAITIIDGTGNSSNMQQYSWMDDAPVNGLCYYRLKQTDIDGAFTYSNAVAVNCGAAMDFSLFPNPASEGFSFLAPPRGNEAALSVVLRSVTGQLVWEQTYAGPTTGWSRTNVDLENVSKGIYFVTFAQGALNRTLKLSVVK